jgi:hypothetical protein
LKYKDDIKVSKNVKPIENGIENQANVLFRITG